MLVFAKKSGPLLAGILKAKDKNITGRTILPGTAITTATGIRVYPNPVIDKAMQVSFSNMPEGDYKVQLISSTGQAVYEGSLFVTGNYFKELIRLGKVGAGCYQLVMVAADGSKTEQSVIIE